MRCNNLQEKVLGEINKIMHISDTKTPKRIEWYIRKDMNARGIILWAFNGLIRLVGFSCKEVSFDEHFLFCNFVKVLGLIEGKIKS
jgi:hypothetical protein